MAKMKTYEEYTQEANEKKAAVEEAKAKRDVSEHELQQAQHRLDRAKNFANYIVGRGNKIRNSRLINKGVAVESICKDSELLDDVEFYHIAEEMLTDEIRQKISDITSGRREGFEQEKQELHELQMEFQKQNRKKKEKV